MKIAISKIKPSPFQTRTAMDGQPLIELKASMKEAGQAVPIKVRPNGTGYQTVYGHRRIEAAKQLKWKEIDAIVEELTDEQAMVQGLAENVQRDDLSPEEEGSAYKRMRDDFGWSGAKIAAEMGKQNTWINRCIRLIEDAAMEPLLRHRDADAVGKADVIPPTIGDIEIRKAIAEKSVDERLTRDQTRKVAKAIKAAPNPKAKQALIDHEYSPFVHDADRIIEQTKRTPGRDPLLTKDRRKDQDWKETPEVAAFLRMMKQWREHIKAFGKAIQIGKLDPSGHAFMVGKIKRLISDLEEIIEELEQ